MRAKYIHLTSIFSVFFASVVAIATSGCDSKTSPTSPVATGPSSGGSSIALTHSSAASTTGDAAAPSSYPSASTASKIPDHLNVIVVSIDSLRADMPWAGYPRDIAPNLSALEKKSVAFTNAHSLSSYTSMSLGGFLGGKYPSELKRDGFFFGTYAKDNLFFPEVLQKAGIHTFSAHAHGYFKDAGFQQGFDEWELVPNLKWNNLTDENVTGEAHEKIAEKLLAHAVPDGDTTKQFFAWFHFLDPHDIYMPHENDGIASFGNKQRDKYDAEVVYTDRQLGKLFAFIDKQAWKDRTAIFITADHGEAFGEHKQFLHGFEVWENLVHVPLFVYVPGVAPAHLETPVSAIDLAPTFLEMLNVPADPSFEGKSLFSSIKTHTEPEAKDVIVDLPETSDNDKRRGLIHGKLKIIASGQAAQMQLFDLGSDPGEEHPITKGDDFDAMVKLYREASSHIKEVPPYACKQGCLNRAYLNTPSASASAGASPTP